METVKGNSFNTSANGILRDEDENDAEFDEDDAAMEWRMICIRQYPKSRLTLSLSQNKKTTNPRAGYLEAILSSCLG